MRSSKFAHQRTFADRWKSYNRQLTRTLHGRLTDEPHGGNSRPGNIKTDYQSAYPHNERYFHRLLPLLRMEKEAPSSASQVSPVHRLMILDEVPTLSCPRWNDVAYWLVLHSRERWKSAHLIFLSAKHLLFYCLDFFNGRHDCEWLLTWVLTNDLNCMVCDGKGSDTIKYRGADSRISRARSR